MSSPSTGSISELSAEPSLWVMASIKAVSVACTCSLLQKSRPGVGRSALTAGVGVITITFGVEGSVGCCTGAALGTGGVSFAGTQPLKSSVKINKIPPHDLIREVFGLIDRKVFLFSIQTLPNTYDPTSTTPAVPGPRCVPMAGVTSCIIALSVTGARCDITRCNSLTVESANT